MHMRSCMRAYATVQKLLCRETLWTYLESCTSIVQAVVAACPPTVSTKLVAWRCLLKKSVQIHANSWRSRRCSVAQASFNHPRWCRPHLVCPWGTLVIGHGGYHKWIHFHNFSRDFFAFFQWWILTNRPSSPKLENWWGAPLAKLWWGNLQRAGQTSSHVW